ncbi:MAG: SynChlorMet cassette protein ScmC [Anaerolineales bacterium]|nr:SynChlorMet cassette protein ScmC [Anaerolineales bacterium]
MRLGEIMQLPAREDRTDHHVQTTRQLVLSARNKSRALGNSMPRAVCAVRRGEPAHCDLELADADDDLLFAQILHFTTLFGAEAQTRGGMLVHGALAVRTNLPGLQDLEGLGGILLTAPGGTGKTTASNRLPAPWVSLCDDTTLIVRDARGEYWAHPTPTWSRFFNGGAGGSWNTSTAVPLCAIFFLEQASLDQAIRLGTGHAAAALVQSVAQASHLMTRDLDEAFARTLRSEWFENASALTRRVPSFHLQLTLTGEFWQEIARGLNWGSRDA